MVLKQLKWCVFPIKISGGSLAPSAWRGPPGRRAGPPSEPGSEVTSMYRHAMWSFWCLQYFYVRVIMLWSKKWTIIAIIWHSSVYFWAWYIWCVFLGWTMDHNTTYVQWGWSPSSGMITIVLIAVLCSDCGPKHVTPFLETKSTRARVACKPFYMFVFMFYHVLSWYFLVYLSIHIYSFIHKLRT